MPRSNVPVLADHTLAQRLERAEAAANARFVEQRAALSPGSGATWTDVGGTYAMFDGVGSPITQSFGLGMFGAATNRELDQLEAFFESCGSPPFHEVSPIAGKDLFISLSRRGYEPFELTSVLYQPLGDSRISDPSLNPDVKVRVARPDETETWAQTCVQGWSEFEEYIDMMLDLARINGARGDTLCFFAELNERPIATGILSIHEGVALLAGASTIPEARKQGAQRALLNARLNAAAEAGCDLAMMAAEPGSASQRNAERHGFRIAYTRVKWRLRESAPS